MHSIIKTTGMYLPKKILTNEDMAKLVETSDEWIFTRTGVKQRHISDSGENTADMAAYALKDALDRALVGADWPQAVLVATTTPPQIFPSTAALVADRLGMTRTMAFDINAVCSGFIYAMSVAGSMIRSGMFTKIAVIGADRMSSIIDWGDRNTCVLFGDGAGAVLLEATTLPRLWHSDCACDGTLSSILEAKEKIVMNGQEVFRHAVDAMTNSSLKVMSEAGLSCDDIDLFIPHQANIRIMNMVASRLGISDTKVISTLKNQANTSAATIPLALHHAIISDRVQSGMKLLLTSAGAGFTWGSMLLEY